MSPEPAYILLEDGTRFEGESVGAGGAVTGEVVFTTGMSGYQESMTDPSFARQLITFTAPHVGNYGVSQEAMESGRIHAAGAIMREAVNAADAPGAEQGWLDWLAAAGVPGISGVDTRALVRHIRDEGAMRGGIFPGAMDQGEAMDRVRAEPSMIGRDLAREVTTPEPVVYRPGESPWPGAPPGIPPTHPLPPARRRRAARASWRSTPASSARSSATSRRAARCSSSSRARRRRTSCSRATRRGSSWSRARATRRRSTTSWTRSAR